MASRSFSRGLWCWILANGRSLRSLFWHLPLYANGTLHPFREQTVPTVPRLLWAKKKWISMSRWELPRLDVCIMDGMGEHYGYPRHYAWLILWWNRRGYVFGVEYAVPDSTRP
jgi:hypothetical protein